MMMDVVHLIDLSSEDDALVPPSPFHPLDGCRRLSVSERKLWEMSPLHYDGVASRTFGSEKPATTEPLSTYWEEDRNSLSWHSSFLTGDGILDAEELIFYNRGDRENVAIRASHKKTAGNKSALKPPRSSGRSKFMAAAAVTRTESMPRVAVKRNGSSTLVPVSRSESMPRLSTKRAAVANGENMASHKKARSWLSSSISSTSMSSSSTGSVKNMLKSTVSFLKRKTDSGVAPSSASPSSLKTPSKSSSKTNSKANNKRAGQHPSHKSMPKLPSWSLEPTSSTDMFKALSPATPPVKETLFNTPESSKALGLSLSFTTLTKGTFFTTPDSKLSKLRMPSPRFGFFDRDQRPSSRLEQILHADVTLTS